MKRREFIATVASAVVAPLMPTGPTPGTYGALTRNNRWVSLSVAVLGGEQGPWIPYGPEDYPRTFAYHQNTDG